MIALIIAFILIGIILFLLELLVFTGFGVAGVLGVGCIITSCILTFDSFGYLYGILVIVINLGFLGLSLFLTLRSKTWKKAMLETNINAKVDTSPIIKGINIGDKGITITRLAPGGQAKIGDHFIEVFSRDRLIDNHTEIEVYHIEDNKIFVKAINN